MAKVYMYVVARDFGFAPNPFHGVCTLATCKPKIRGPAKPGDWVVGMGGQQLDATGRCVYFMKVTDKMTFNEYWNAPQFKGKRPVRNGSRKVMLGDNIYHRDDDNDPWTQEDSHHSKPDGSPEWWNVETDTGADSVLISTRFVYFGSSAPEIPKGILTEIGYENRRSHRTFYDWQCGALIAWMGSFPTSHWNLVLSDPFQFAQSGARYSRERNAIVA